MVARRHYTTRQVAEICGVNLNTIQNWARRDLIEGFRTAGGHLRFQEDAVKQFLERQGIPLPSELTRPRPKVYCLCNECKEAKAAGAWLKRDFDCTVFEDPWELAMALGASPPDLMVVDAVDARPEVHGMLKSLASSPRSAHVPTIVLRAAGPTLEPAPGGPPRAELPVEGLKPAELRKSAARLLAR